MEVPARRKLLLWERLLTAPSSWPWREMNSMTRGPKDAPRNRPEVALIQWTIRPPAGRC